MLVKGEKTKDSWKKTTASRKIFNSACKRGTKLSKNSWTEKISKGFKVFYGAQTQHLYKISHIDGKWLIFGLWSK